MIRNLNHVARAKSSFREVTFSYELLVKLVMISKISKFISLNVSTVSFEFIDISISAPAQRPL